MTEMLSRADTDELVTRHVGGRSFRMLIGGELVDGQQRATTVKPTYPTERLRT
jgi:hypothetical protein